MAARTPGRRHSANPTGGVRRHLPLHKGGFFALVHTTGPGSVAQRGSGPVSGRPKLSLRWFIQLALVLLPSAGAQYDSGGTPPLLDRGRGEGVE